jgi:hypothetical protein
MKTAAEKLAEEILSKLETIIDIDPCGLNRSQVINAISRIIDENKNLVNNGN